jgi:oligopeptide transport system permease protein
MVDMALMRIAEIMDSVPYLLVVIIISVALNSTSIPVLLFAMSVTAWCSTARIVRAQMLQINSMEYILAARIMGAPPMGIVFRHLIPNSLSVIIVSLTFRIPGFIFSEAFLSYVGLGVQAPATSWGALCSIAMGTLQFYPYQMFFPAFFIALTMLCFTLIGDGLRDALDPRLRS